MRLKESVVVSATPRQVWDYVDDPANWLHFMAGVTRWEVTGDIRSGLGARYRMLFRVGSAEVGGLVEMVEWDEPRDLAWNSVTGVDQRGRLRIREVDSSSSRIELRYAYGVAGAGIPGLISEWVSAPTISGHLRRSLQQLKRQVEHEKLRAEAARRRAARERSPA